MLNWQNHRKLSIFIKTICVALIVAFFSYDLSWAGATEVIAFRSLPSLSQMPFVPPTLKYLSVNEANPRNYFNFLLDKGQLSVTDKDTLNKEAKQLINYFFIGLTLPDDVFWVNLKPAESDRITSEQLSRTDIGRTLLEQDFRLKRDVSQYLNPQNPIGRLFWERLYSILGKDKVKKSGITTSNRVWIVPAEAVVVETDDGVLLARSSLKVLLESEYAALKLTKQHPLGEFSFDNSDNLKSLTEQLMKEIVIPAITKDVNESQDYAPLRQIYHSLILAQWFKRRHKNADSDYAQAIDKSYLNGLESQLPWEKQQIWQEYLKSYKQGEYKIQDTIFGLKRMYFSGGVIFDLGAASFPLTIIGQKELPDLLKQDPDFLSKLMKSDSFKNDLVVLTERQGNQENIGEQSLVQDINIVSSQGGTLEETIIQQAGKEKPEPLELTPKVEASSPVNPNLKAKVKKTFIMAVLACAIFFSNLQPALAHYFITGPQGKPQAVVEVWNKNTPADNTLGGIGKNILIAEGKKVTPQALYGKDGLVNKIAGENQIPNPDLLKANQQISISGLSSLTQEKLIRVQGLKKAQSDLEAGKMSIEEKNRKLESENLVLKEKLNDLDKRINNIGENTDRFDENNRKSLDDSGGSQKGIMYILAALGIGTVLLGLGLYRRRQRLEQFKAGISLKKEERDQLDAQIETQKQAIKELNAQIEKAKLALTEAEKKAQEINQRDREKELSVLLREEETRLAVLKENVTQLQKEQSQYEETIRTLKNNIAEYQQEIGGLEDKKDKTKQEGLSISEEAVTAAAYVDEVNQKITESEGILGGLKEEIIQLEANKNSLEAGIAVSQEKKIKFESELLTLDQRSQVLSQEIAALEAQRDTLARKEIELNASINEKNIRLKEIDEKISILPTAGQEEALQISALQEQKIQLEVELERLSQQVVDLNREYAQSQEKIELSKKSLAGLKQDSDAISAGIKEMSMKSSQLKNEIAALGDRKINLDEKVVNLNNTLANTQKELSDVQAILRGSLSDRDALRQEVEELGREKKELEIEVEKIRKSSVTKPPVEAPLTKDIEVISKAKQEYADIALQFQGVQNTTDKNVFTELCERLTAFTNSLDQLIRSEVSSERDRANQELRNASNRLIQAAKRIRDEIKIEIEALSQLDHSADFEAGVSQLQAKYPLEIFNEFTETIRKIREDIGLKEMVLEEQRAKEADLLGSFTARYQAIIEEIPQAASKDDLKEIMNKLDGLDGTVKANKQLSNILKPLQKEARDSISQREDELKVISKSLYRRISLSTLWQIFKHYFLVPWWIGSQLNNALSPQGLARKVSEIYSKYTTIIDWFNKQEFYRAFKHRSEQLGLSKEFDKSGAVAEFNVEGDPTPYHLELSDRSPEYLIRGYFSGDCTNPAIPFAHSSFQSATLNHLIMPGFLNFKVMRGKGWVGNIYAVVIEDKGKPVLLIDAVQVPWRVWGGIFLQPRGAYAPFWLPFKLFPIRTFRKAVRISDASLKALEKYAHNSGFNQIWHSEFVSNFYDFKDYYDNIAKERKYQESPSINSNMIIGWPEIQRDMHLSALYIESLNRKAWRIWTKEETQVKQTLATDSRPLKAPQAEVVMPQSPEQVIKGISEGKYITQDTQELLKKIFGVTPAYLSKALSQRFSESGKFKKVLGILGSGQTIAQWMRQNKRESGYDAFESQLKQLGIDPEFDNSNTLAFGVNNDERKYYLISSERNADDLARGYISGDCTNPSWQFASHTFNKYVPEHLLSPGFLNFKVFRAEPHSPAKWIGNVYTAVLRQNNSGILLIDAIQIPWAGIKERFGMELLPLPPPYNGKNPAMPFSVKNLEEAEKISDAIIAFLSAEYAPKFGFKKTYLGFGSNFIPLVEHLYKEYANNYINTLPPAEKISQKIGNVSGVALPRNISPISESEYLSRLQKLDLNLIGLDKDKLDSFPGQPYARRGFAEIKPLKTERGNTALLSIDPIFGYFALAGWLIYLGYKGIKWLINRQRQNIPYQAERDDIAVSIVPAEDIHAARVVSEGILERRTVGALIPLTEAERASIQLRLGSVVDRVTQGSIETWPQTFVKAFKKGKTKILWEMPLPVPVSRIRKEPSSRNQALMILRFLKVWMDAADSRVIRDLRNGIEQARESVTEEALNNLRSLGDEQLVELLTTEYQNRFGKEINKNIERFISHVRRFQGPSPEERGLYVSPEIQSRYERLPRYLKWIFTQNPGLDNDLEIQELIRIIYEQMMRLPAFSAEIESFAKDAFSESIKLNPELGLRLFEYVTKDIPTQDELLLRLKSSESAPTYSYPTAPQLEAPQGQRVPIAALPDLRQKEEDLKRQDNLANSLKQALEEFKSKLNQRRSSLQAKEKDLQELTEAYEDARRAGENYTADVLIYAKEGAESEVKHLKEEVASFEERVKAYEAQIKSLGKAPSGNKTSFYSISSPPAIMLLYDQIKELFISYGIPNNDYIVIPFLILSPWIISTIMRVLIRNIFPAKSDPVKVHNLVSSRGWLWSIFAFPFLFIGYFAFIARPWLLMGRQGLYSYWERKNPGYYRVLKDEMQGLSNDFRKPGEKFRVAYDRKNVDLDPGFMEDPIKDELTVVKELLKQVSLTQPALYKKIKNAFYGRRPIPEYRELFEVIKEEEIKEVMAEFIKRLQNINISSGQKLDFLAKAYELIFSGQTKKLREKISRSRDRIKKAGMCAEYWQSILNLLNKDELTPKSSKFLTELISGVKKRISLFSDSTERPRQGLLQFYLSGVTFTDFFSGHISEDCTRSMYFFRFTTTKLDPAFMLFKVVEDGRWVGNLYTMILKDSEGNEALLLDSFQTRMEHPLLKASDGQIKDTLKTFLERLKSYLTQEGFKMLLVSGRSVSSRSRISEILNELVSKESVNVSGSFKKPGGIAHRRIRFSISPEYIQALGEINSENVSFSGQKILLRDIRAEHLRKNQLKQEAIIKKNAEMLSRLTDVLSEYTKEKNGIGAQLEEKKAFLQQLRLTMERETEKNRSASANVISAELEKIDSTVADLEIQLNEARSKVEQQEGRIKEIQGNLGVENESNGVSPGVRAAVYSFLISGFLFANVENAAANALKGDVFYSLPMLAVFIPIVAAGALTYMLYRIIKNRKEAERDGYPDIPELIKEMYPKEASKQLKAGRVILNPRNQKQIVLIKDIAEQLNAIHHPENNDINSLSLKIINQIRGADIDENIRKSLLIAAAIHLSWAKQKIKFVNSLRFIGRNSSIDQRSLVERLLDYLCIPSKSGQELSLREYIVKQLTVLGGRENKITEQTPQMPGIPNNLIWDIPASENYKGEPLRIGLHAHLDTTTHTPTFLIREGEHLVAEGTGVHAEAGLDDAVALAGIMEVIQDLKEKGTPHPDIRVIFTAEEEAGKLGVSRGARYLVDNYPEAFNDIDLLISIDGPLLNKKSPLAAKFINFGTAREKQKDVCYEVIKKAAIKVSNDDNSPEEFDFSAGDEQTFKAVEGLRIAHFRANYSQGHTLVDSIKLEHLVLLTEWIREIAQSLNRKPAARPTSKNIAKEIFLNSLPVLSQADIQNGIQDVISNSGKLTPGMEFIIYEESPHRRLLQFKHVSFGKLTLTTYIAGKYPDSLDLAIDDESIFDAAGNIFIMRLLNSKSVYIIKKDGKDIPLSAVLKDYNIPRYFNPEVGGLVIKNSADNKSAEVIEFPCKGFVQIKAISRGISRMISGQQSVPFVHLKANILTDRWGRFKGLELPHLYDLLKEQYDPKDIFLGFHTHPDDSSNNPGFSYLDLDELKNQSKPEIFPLELVIGNRSLNFLYHFRDSETKQIREITLNLRQMLKEEMAAEDRIKLASLVQQADSLPPIVRQDKNFYTFKGKGIIDAESLNRIDQIIQQAKKEGRGHLIWGDSREWKDAKEEYSPEIRSIIGYLRGYPKVEVPIVGTVDISEVLSSANMILVESSDNSPGIVVNNENSYQVAFNDIVDNSIKIDAVVYSNLSYNYIEKAALLAHEAIELGAKRLCREKGIHWMAGLADEVDKMAEDYEVTITGKSSVGKGSRLDERIEQILGFTALLRQTEIKPTESKRVFVSEIRKSSDPRLSPQVRVSSYQKSETRKAMKLDVMEYSDSLKALDSLKTLLENLSQDTSKNLPARYEAFPLPIAREIRKAHLFLQVKGLPVDIDFLAALSLFFARIFPNHVDNLLKYVSNLYIYMSDNRRSTYGATLRDNTLYIQRSCIEDLIGRPISVKEIYRAVENKDTEILAALFRIIIHEVGGALFKLSHEANQDLEKLFVSLLSKTETRLSTKTEQELDKINQADNLDSIPRTDWAAAETFIHDPSLEDIPAEELDKLPSVLMDQAVLESIRKKEPRNEIMGQSAISVEQKVSSSDKADIAANPGGIDLSKIEITLKDEKFISNLNPADLKILRAARALNEGQDSLAVLYVHEVRLILKDNILSERDITQGALLQSLLAQLEYRELLNPEAIEFCHILQGQEIISGKRLAFSGIK